MCLSRGNSCKSQLEDDDEKEQTHMRRKTIGNGNESLLSSWEAWSIIWIWSQNALLCVVWCCFTLRHFHAVRKSDTCCFTPFMLVHTAKLITLVILSGCCVAFVYYAGPPEALEDWSNGFEPRWGNLDAAVAASARRHWHLVRCQNGKSRWHHISFKHILLLYCCYRKTVL